MSGVQSTKPPPSSRTAQSTLLGVVDHLAWLRRLDHHLDDLLDAGLAARPVPHERLVQVVVGPAQVDVGPEQRPERAGIALVRKADAARVHAPDPRDLAVELDVHVRGHDHALVDALAELADALLRRLRGDALLVSPRRAVANANRPQALDIDDDLLFEAAEEVAQLVGVARLHPLLPLGLGAVFQHRTVCVPPHEAGVQAAHELEGLLRERAPGEVASEDDQVDVCLLDLGEDGSERGRVPVHV
jgi:hypothetical protein